jgi:hypothetical protein
MIDGYAYCVNLTIPAHLSRRWSDKRRKLTQMNCFHSKVFALAQGFSYRAMVFTSPVNNITAISWWSVLVVMETGVPGKKPLKSH